MTDTAIRNAKVGDKQRKLGDKRGLFLLIHPNGSKYWRMKYRYARKEKVLSLGVYPDVSLKDARERRDEARKLLSNDVDPNNIKKQTKQLAREAIENSFESIAREWFGKHSPNWSGEHSKRVFRSLEKDVYPWLGDKPIAEITPPELLAVVCRIEERGALETAHRVLGYCGTVFRYAVATKRAERDPSGDLKGALPPYKSKLFASITDPKEIGQLLRALQSYKGTFLTRSALKLVPMLFVRPGELRKAEWNDVYFDKCEWASTILNEQGWDDDAIERQLAHVEGNRVRAAYNYAQYLDERRKMMQHWTDYLQSLEEGASVVPIFRKAT